MADEFSRKSMASSAAVSTSAGKSGSSSSGVSTAPGPLTPQRLDALIASLLMMSYDDFTRNVSMVDIWQLCEEATNVFKAQPPMVDVQAPVIMCGDIHGQFSDLKRIFSTMGYPPNNKYLFLGDIVDRGNQSLETIVLLLCYKVRYPAQFYMLRGNHECASINRTYGFYEEIGVRYGIQNAQPLWDRFNETFAWLPYAGLVNNCILCMHGGISPDLHSIQQLRLLRRPHLDPPCPSLELDLLWADPANISGVQTNPRGVSILFGPEVVAEVCSRLDIVLIVRAHQCVPYGVDFFSDAYLLTLFSAPSYQTERNTGAVLTIDANLKLSFRFFA